MTDPGVRVFQAGEFDPTRLAASKGDQRVSVCLPARNEEPTVGPIVDAIRRTLVEVHGLVDEIVVVDDHSHDRTAAVAADAGARVVAADTVLPELAVGHGKGAALWKSLYAAHGDLVVWCDADLVDFDPGFVVGLLGPLLTEPGIGFVKAFYDRPIDGRPRGGGRVTELVARPALALLFPHLSSVVQPLAGEYAGRRDVLERVPFVQGYGVDIALLIDIASRFGAGSIAQVDLGVRVHRNRPIEELAPMAAEVLSTVLRRADPELVSRPRWLTRPGHEPFEISYEELPPLVDLDADRPG